jgi:hypothetical protein
MANHCSLALCMAVPKVRPTAKYQFYVIIKTNTGPINHSIAGHFNHDTSV